MPARTRKEQADLEAAVRPSTDQLFTVIRENSKYMAGSAAEMRAGFQATNDRLSAMESAARETNGHLGELVRLSSERSKREEAESVARQARDKASEDALVRRTNAEIEETTKRGAWFRGLVGTFGERLVLPAGTILLSILAGVAASKFGASTQTVTVEAPRTAPVETPAPPPVPDPEPVPAAIPNPPVRAVHDDLMEY